MNRKVKRHSGWVTPQLHQKINQSEMIANAWEPIPFYDNWQDWRDGFRHNPDRTHLRNENMLHRDRQELKKQNWKIKRQIRIRKSKKFKKMLKNNLLFFTEHL